MKIKIVVMTLSFFFLLPGLMGLVFADEADDLARQASKALRAAERNMMSGKKDEAVEGLLGAAKLVEKLRAASPGHKQLGSLDGKVKKLKKDLERRTGRTIDLESGEVKEKEGATPKKKEEKKPTQEKLPGGVTHRLKNVDRPLKRAEELISGKNTRGSDDYRIKQAGACIEQARSLVEDAVSGYGEYKDHPQVKAAETSIAAMEEKLAAFSRAVEAEAAAAEKASEAKEALCAEWMKEIGPYVIGLGREGHDPDKYLTPGATADADDLNKRRRIFEEAKTVFQAYQKVEFPSGKTWELEQAEETLARVLEDFPRAYEESVGYLLNGALGEIDRTSAFLKSEKQQQWREDDKVKPYVLAEDRLESLRAPVDRAAEALPGDHPALVSAREKLADILKRNRERRRVRTERTFMIPDRFNGREAGDVRSKAEVLVKGEAPDAKVLRATVISEDWKEESVIEATDTTGTAIRHRVTRSLSAQVAARVGDEVFLYTVHVAKNRRTDGSWGSLYGNVMFIDPMLERNVNK